MPRRRPTGTRPANRVVVAEAVRRSCAPDAAPADARLQLALPGVEGAADIAVAFLEAEHEAHVRADRLALRRERDRRRCAARRAAVAVHERQMQLPVDDGRVAGVADPDSVVDARRPATAGSAGSPRVRLTGRPVVDARRPATAGSPSLCLCDPSPSREPSDARRLGDGATGIDARLRSNSRSDLAPDDPRRPLLELVAEQIAARILRGGGAQGGGR